MDELERIVNKKKRLERELEETNRELERAGSCNWEDAEYGKSIQYSYFVNHEAHQVVETCHYVESENKMQCKVHTIVPEGGRYEVHEETSLVTLNAFRYTFRQVLCHEALSMIKAMKSIILEGGNKITDARKKMHENIRDLFAGPSESASTPEAEDAEKKAVQSESTGGEDKAEEAMDIIVQYGGIDGAHHKDWVIDQVFRVLAGDSYEQRVKEACDGEDGEDTYSWDTGIAP